MVGESLGGAYLAVADTEHGFAGVAAFDVVFDEGAELLRVVLEKGGGELGVAGVEVTVYDGA
jgi:hypothetical protein